MSDKLWKLGIEKLDLDITDAHVEKLQHYVTLLDRWNKTYNLTAIRNPNDMIPAHIFDSLVVAPYIDGENCLDVGSGAGLPGIPLSILQPDRQFTMLDTNGKKTRFIQQAIIELGLPNASVVQSRVAEWKPERQFDAIISRAFASIEDFVNGCSMHLNEKGSIYAMKGLFPSEELIHTPKGYELVEKIVLEVPYLEGERHLLKIINTA